MGQVSRGVIIASCLLLVVAAVSHAQVRQSAEVLLGSLEGPWGFTIRSANGTQLDVGTRVFTSLGPLRLEWVDRHADGRVSDGTLVFNEARDEFEYGFSSESWNCTVAGHLVEPGTVRFGREGACRDVVIKSMLVLIDSDHHTFRGADGVWVAEFTRESGRQPVAGR